MSEDQVVRTIAIIAWAKANRQSSVSAISGSQEFYFGDGRGSAWSGQNVYYTDPEANEVVEADVSKDSFYIYFGSYTINDSDVDLSNPREGYVTYRGKQYKTEVSGNRVYINGSTWTFELAA